VPCGSGEVTDRPGRRYHRAPQLLSGDRTSEQRGHGVGHERPGASPRAAGRTSTNGDGSGHQAPPRRHRRLRRTLIALGVLGVVLALAVGSGLWFLGNRYGGNIARVGDVFAGLEQTPRPAAPSPVAGADPVTFLLVGSDTRAELARGDLPDARSDAIMIARFSGDRQHAQVVSIPRDSWVDIPGRGNDKINAAYAFGGPTLLIQTVEQLTGVRIDHFAAIDFDGLIQVTDDLGGVDVVVAETTSNGPYTFTAGVNHLTGDQARWYVGQRYDLAGGDFDRVRRQQNYLRSMFGKLFSQDVFTSPGKLDGTLLAVTSAVAVDDGVSNTAMATMAYSLRGLTPDSVEFFTAPVLGTGREGPASVVHLDAATGERMWGYLHTDSLGQNADEFSDEALPEIPR
jgi:LCP family protein required for cell wall assembly